MRLKKLLFFIFILGTAMTTKAQYGFDFDIRRDPQSGSTMYVGRCTYDDLSDEASFDWLQLGSDNYKPELAITDELKTILPSCDLVIFMGTWCEDTHNLLPKLYKTMMLTHCFTNYKMYAVDREKKSKAGEEEAWAIVNVPTIIILKNGKELGRIVETTKVNIETDLLAIVKNAQ